MEKIWEIDSLHPNVEKLAKELDISETTAQILANRGFDLESGRKFLRASLSDLHDPYLMEHMKTIVQRINQAIENKEKVMVYGDYDVDGMTSTAIMIKILRQLGLEVFYYLPNRLVEDYGLGKKGIDHAKKKGASLIITVDCGINADQEINYAEQKGLDVIVTDHHELESGKPSVPFLNPKGDNYPFKELAGAGVVLKLVQALMQEHDCDNFDNYIEIASVGTVTDVVPLVDENRIIVKNGLVFLQHSVNLGLDALKNVSGVDKVTASDIGFKLGPRLNAAGRLGRAELGLKLLLTDKKEKAKEIAETLNRKNNIRQNIEKDVLEEAIHYIINEDLKDNKFLVIDKKGWHKGVIGIVASRISEKFYRPTVIIAKDKGLGYGSGRSIKNFNLFKALSHCKQHFESFGGHEKAAGLSIKSKNIEDFKKDISQYAEENLGPEDLKPKQNINAIVPLSEITEEVIKEMEELKPFGLGNPRPVICSTNLHADNVRVLKGKHVKTKLKDGSKKLGAIGFNMSDLAEKIANNDGYLHACYAPQFNTWNGKTSIQLNLKDVKIGKLKEKKWYEKVKGFLDI